MTAHILKLGFHIFSYFVHTTGKMTGKV